MPDPLAPGTGVEMSDNRVLTVISALQYRVNLRGGN